MPGPPVLSFVSPFTDDSPRIGGKARSLARLARLGLPVPPGFAVTSSLFEVLRVGGPALPTRLECSADLEALDAARAALFTASFPPGFEQELGLALDAVDAGAVDARAADADDGVPNGRPTAAARFAVRSSTELEDRDGMLAAGIHSSLLPISRAQVPAAIREVLASFLSPAAWVYAAGAPTAVGQGPVAVGGAVAIHLFVEGDSAGTAACALAPGASATTGNRSDLNGVASLVRVDATGNAAPTPLARSRIEGAARAASRVHGAVELEWVARVDNVTFLQLRAHRAAPPSSGDAAGSAGSSSAVFSAVFSAIMGGGGLSDPQGAGGWTWDAAHNPLPLSAAQAGLVELVDARCRLGFRQQVVGGYLFYRKVPGPSTGSPTVASARDSFARLQAAVASTLESLAAHPGLESALDLFVAAYEPLFGVIGPACAAARERLADFLAHHFPDGAKNMSRLLAGVASTASRRTAAAGAVVCATTPADRQAAIDSYLLLFGDESARWDVAEPTLRETPGRLLLLTAATRASNPSPGRGPPVATGPGAGAMMGQRLSPVDRARFEALVADARVAAALGEDDDALFARLQAAVRRALLGVGRRLAEAGLLDQESEVFDLPLSVVRAHDPLSPCLEPPATDLRPLAAAGRRAYQEARDAPPPVPASRDRRVLRGQAGSKGRLIGRAVHHPALTPLSGDTVLIAATLLPTELPLLTPGAIVVETGQVLGHVAAQARERDIPAVVGAAGARAAIREGALVAVDGDRGEVVLLD